MSLNSFHIDAGIAQLVEHNLAKVGVASSSLVSRSKIQALCMAKCIKTQEIVSRSSSGLGHCPFTAVTGVRVPYGMPYKFLRNLSVDIFRRKMCGNSSVGRAQPCQGWGREFESRFPLQFRFGCEIKPCQGWGRLFITRCESRFPLQIRLYAHQSIKTQSCVPFV